MKAQTRTSLQIAEYLGIRHADLMKVIRRLEKAWIEVNEGSFSLVEYRDAKGESRPCYNLTFEQTLFVTSKYNDKQRAMLIKRWKELETQQQQIQQPESMADMFAESRRLADEMREDLASGKILPATDVILSANDVAIYSYLRNGIRSSREVPFVVTNTMISKALGIDKADVIGAWGRLERGGYIIRRKLGDGHSFILGSRQP